MAQHAGYYSPNLDKNTTTIPGQVKYTIAGMRYYAPDKTVTIYLQGTGNGKKRSASLYSDDVYVVECRKFTSASSAVNNLVRNAKPQHKSLLSQPSIQKKIIAELNEDYYDLAGRPQHSGYYSPNIGYDPYFEHSDDDEVIDMTEIEDTLKHSNSESQQYKLDKVYYPGVAGVPNSAEIVFKPIGSNLGAQGKKTLVIRAETIKNISSIQELKSLIERRYKAELEDKSSLYTSPHSLAPGEAAKAASKIWITFGRGGESSVRHSAFNDQLASNDDKAKYYKYMSGKYDPKTKNVTLKFSNGLYNVQVVCQGSMYGRVNSLPEMKEYVQNAFYAEVGAHKYLDSSNASKAAVYLWDAKNSHFGKANPLSRLQHSALANADKTPAINAKYVSTVLDYKGIAQTIDQYIPEDKKWHRTVSFIDYGNVRDPKTARILSNMSPSTFRKDFIRTTNLRMSEEDYTRAAEDLRQLALKIINTKKTPADWRVIDNMRHSAFTVVSSYDEDYLEHHGILGMKWGVRRYQNANGTLTAEGRERYGIKTKSTGGNSEYSTGIDKLKSKYEKNLTDATMQRRSAIHYQNKPNGEKASKFTRASMAGALDKADRYEKKAEKIKNKAEKKYGAKFEINDRDYKEVYDEVMKYYERKTTSEIGKEYAAWLGKNLILGGALGGALWSTLDLAEGKNINSKYKIKE